MMTVGVLVTLMVLPLALVVDDFLTEVARAWHALDMGW